MVETVYRALKISVRVRTWRGKTFGIRNSRYRYTKPKSESTYREVAQLVAHLVWDQRVAGSSPVFPTFYCRFVQRLRTPGSEPGNICSNQVTTTNCGIRITVYYVSLPSWRWQFDSAIPLNAENICIMWLGWRWTILKGKPCRAITIRDDTPKNRFGVAAAHLLESRRRRVESYNANKLWKEKEQKKKLGRT